LGTSPHELAQNILQPRITLITRKKIATKRHKRRKEILATDYTDCTELFVLTGILFSGTFLHKGVTHPGAETTRDTIYSILNTQYSILNTKMAGIVDLGTVIFLFWF
jgi:hypothetical protein